MSKQGLTWDDGVKKSQCVFILSCFCSKVTELKATKYNTASVSSAFTHIVVRAAQKYFVFAKTFEMTCQL